MSEWIRHRGSKAMPKCLEGKRFEVRHRAGTTAYGNAENLILEWRHLGFDWDILAYRILGDIATPDYSKGFPRGTTAEDIGAKVGDRFVVVSDEHHLLKRGDIVVLERDDKTPIPYFSTSRQESLTIIDWHSLAPIPPKTAIELQAEEVGIHEPVRLVDDDTHLGIKRPDGDGWVKYNAGDVVDLDGVVSIDWADAIGYNMTCPEPKELRWADNEKDQIAWYRLNYGDTSQHYTNKQQAAEADKRIDNAAQGVREAFGRKLATTEPVTAGEFLRSALNALTQRGKDYDKPEGERSAAAVAVAFNAITGRNMTEAEVWLILQLVKDVRQWQNPDRYHADSALDCVAYAALKAEALAGSGK